MLSPKRFSLTHGGLFQYGSRAQQVSPLLVLRLWRIYAISFSVIIVDYWGTRCVCVCVFLFFALRLRIEYVDTRKV